MGQNQSTKELERRPPIRPKAPPSARPISELGPKGPSYHNPENRVLPQVVPGLMQLRPVSQELSAIHPEYKQIFAYEDDVDEGHSSLHEDLENHEPVIDNKPRQANGTYPNGILKHSDSASDTSSSGRGTSSDAQKRYKMHRRQQSASSSLYVKENTIDEEDSDNEHLDNRGKIDPLSSSCPHVSLPVKSAFQLDSSMNLTYAQLAEKRRNKTLSMIEQKTGKRIEDLSDDLLEHVRTKPLPNLVRSSSTKSMKSNVSFASGESGVSKKKKKAPLPPTNAPPAPPMGSRSAPTTPRATPKRMMSQPPPRPTSPPPPPMNRAYSVPHEPPVDYDLDDSPRRSPQKSAVPPPPPPPPNGILRNTRYNSNNARRSMNAVMKRNSYESAGNSPDENILKSQPSTPRGSSYQVPYKAPPVTIPKPKTDPFLMEIQKLAESKAIRRQMSENLDNLINPPERNEDTSVQDPFVSNSPNLERETNSSEIFSSENMEKVPNVNQSSASVNVIEKTETIPPPPGFGEGKSSRAPNEDDSGSVRSNKSADSGVRRLSSLLQHDIKLAAQAKANKVVKKQTPVREKPIDPAEVFKQQLAKAAAERKNKQINSQTIDDLIQRKKSQEITKRLGSSSDEETENKVEDKSKTVFKSDSFVVKKKESAQTKEKITIDLEVEDKEFPRPPPVTDSPENPVVFSRNSRQRIPYRDDSIAKKINGHSSHASNEWVPEDDLESDDNLSDRETMTARGGNIEGFKSTIVPKKVNELQQKEKGKKSKNKENRYQKKNNEFQDERKKFDSIKKFKKSVRSGVMNAFGSISKAGGKMLKNKKSEEIVQSSDPERNWKLSSSASVPDILDDDVKSSYDSAKKRGSFSSEKAYKHLVPNGYTDHESDSSDQEEGGEESKSVGFENGVSGHSEEESDEDIHNMKRAGVAYVSRKGQIVVLPEFETVQVDKDGKMVHGFSNGSGRAPKIHQKKKKFTYDATVRKKEREEVDKSVSEVVKQKETERDMERKQESATEQEFKKMRELEARERLQKLEAQAQLQQQLLQHQQQLLSAPPLPPPSGFQQGYNPMDYSQFLAQASLPQGSLNLPFGNQSIITAPVYGTVPYNDFTEYMRMLQSSAGNPQQHYTYLLNSMNWPSAGLMVNSQVFPTKSSSQDFLDRDRNQVFNSWVGPAKQQASKANIVQSQTVTSVSSTAHMHNSLSPISSNTKSTSSKSHQRTNIMINDNESDISDGLSPMKTEASLHHEGEINGIPIIHTAVDDDGAHRTKISISGAYHGRQRQNSISSASSQPCSETSAER